MNPDKGNLHTTTQRVSQVGRASEAPPPRPPSAPPLAPLGRPRSQPPLCFRTQLAAAVRLLPSALAHSRHIQTAGVWLAGSQEKYVEEVGCRRRRKAAIHGHRGVFIRFGCWFFSPIANPASDKDSKIEGRFITPSSPSYMEISPTPSSVSSPPPLNDAVGRETLLIKADVSGRLCSILDLI